MTASQTSTARPTLGRMLWRGVRRRCAWCGGRGAFLTGWFRKRDRCASCGLQWQRGYEGFELGAIAFNTIMVFFFLLGGLLLVIAIPALQGIQALLVLAVIAILGPILAYPVSHTLWQAVDLAMHPPELDDPDTPAPKP